MLICGEIVRCDEIMVHEKDSESEKAEDRDNEVGNKSGLRAEVGTEGILGNIIGSELGENEKRNYWTQDCETGDKQNEPAVIA